MAERMQLRDLDALGRTKACYSVANLPERVRAMIPGKDRRALTAIIMFPDTGALWVTGAREYWKPTAHYKCVLSERS